ncbi:thioredoxin family protein [Rhodoferax sp.]|uniref:thioredoxin family protein n=1 Tax=Rhodoferax sp. TaxID=50421 RepID=UPI00374D2E26
MRIPHTLLAAALFGASALAQALTLAPYSPEALAKAQAAGQPVALHFRADWCPTCRAQDKVLDSLKSDAALNITVLAVDYDKEVDLKKQDKVRAQSTFIVYKGKQETARMVGETTPEAVRAVLRSAL